MQTSGTMGCPLEWRSVAISMLQGLAGIGTGRSDLQRRDEVLSTVLADLADGQLASREHHRFGQTGQHERERRGGVGHGVCAMQDDEACILVVVVADDAYQFAPGIGVHVRGIHGRVELISVDTERKSLKFGNMFLQLLEVEAFQGAGFCILYHSDSSTGVY